MKRDLLYKKWEDVVYIIIIFLISLQMFRNGDLDLYKNFYKYFANIEKIITFQES